MGKDAPNLSPNVVIMTRDEFARYQDAAFQRGVERGKFEATTKRNERTAKTCANWHDGRCETCGVQWQGFEVDASYKCPQHTMRAALKETEE